jgi:SAM-dependent methyltransferase
LYPTEGAAWRRLLFPIEFFETYLNLSEAGNILQILDIGSKNWFYAEGEYSFFKYNSFEKEIYLTGIELDAYRLYTDLYSRYDYAAYYIRNLNNTNYIAEDFLCHQDNYDYITWFFPFVTTDPLINWGLPLKFFKPQDMLEHAYSLLKPNGTLIIVNQGKEECIEQENLLVKLSIPYSPKGCFKSVFLDFSFERYITIVQKK